MMDRDSMTINEWRTKHHMEPLDGADVTLAEWRTTHGFAPEQST